MLRIEEQKGYKFYFLENNKKKTFLRIFFVVI